MNALVLRSLLFFCLLAEVRADTETIVCLRHGEKSLVELGQLGTKGLNRALALPDVLLARFGPPQAIFAPDPARNQMSDGKQGSPLYDYVRPLATIEPTAIRFALPVNAHFGYKDIAGLEAELLKPAYRNAVVLVAWEHLWEAKFVTKLVADLGGSPGQVPPWAGDDYDSLYVVRIDRNGSAATVSFRVDHEGLNGMSTAFPLPAPTRTP